MILEWYYLLTDLDKGNNNLFNCPLAAIFWLDQLTLEFAEPARQGHVVVVCGPVDEELEPGVVIAQ